ncbi:hypothetical protein IIE18_10570 [Pseudomonas sp. V1]|uniref:hypothetical protein n=1 Tax=Pseudomonas arcuscaelestis TaxID=2710591 RepID=UPI00193F074A|nr:hypothetical protein [Pseudomonas arcuscaelestis]MBM3105583.1 hypothetical protein [Pseudomonas arcuscaelestis]
MSLSAAGFAKAQQWLLDEGYCRDEVATAEQLQALVQELETEGNRLISLADDIRLQLSAAYPADNSVL